MPRLFELLPDQSEKKLREKYNAPRTRTRAGGERKGRSNRRHTRAHRPRAGRGGVDVPDFVAIDLETTGLDYRSDRIIEIGVVRFKHGMPGEEFSALVNPGVSVPDAITQLTGIENSTIAGAPRFCEIVDTLLSFIGSYPLCGHQVEFDIKFLNDELKRQGRERLKNQSLDSAGLSRLVLVSLRKHSLTDVARALDIPLHNAHRALDDARASGKIAAALIPRLTEISPRTRRIIASFAPSSALKTILFRSLDVRHEGSGAQPAERTLPRVPKKLPEPKTIEDVDRDEVEECFAPQGPLSRAMKGFVPRDAQTQMALAVADTLNSDCYLVAEAGTGVGKSLAYLVPAALWAHRNNARVLVSAHTRNVGDQLVRRDLPILAVLVGDGFSFSVLKGRANYLCVNRFRRLLAGEHGNLSLRERFAILPLIRWAEETETGDIEEQNLFNRRWFGKVWSLVSAESHDCEGRRCRHNDHCFLQRARRKALGSHVVVINHALFFSEICSESSFLGTMGPIVFDEAHHLEACGHRHLRVELDTNRINRYLESLDSLLKVLQKTLDAQWLIEAARKLKANVRQVRKSAEEFQRYCEDWVTRNFPDTSGHYQHAYRDRPFAASGGLASFQIAMDQLQDTVLALQRRWRESESDGDSAYGDIVACTERTSQLKADIEYLTIASTEAHVFWIEGNRDRGWVKLCGVPLDIGGMLATIWSSRAGPIAFTSATLSVLGSAEYFKHKVGLDSLPADRVLFECYRAPFSPEQVLRCVVSGELDPDVAGYTRYVARCIGDLLRALEKNILVLFTSNAMMSAVYDHLKAERELPPSAVVLAQHASGSRQVLLEQFKLSRRAALLGTDSFWEGIDAPGGECEIVIVPRLPFQVPTHPLTKAIAERYEMETGDSFRSYSVPEALIRFRQGAGRLIRTTEDRGAFIVLDRRMATKSYGRMFAGALDGEFVFSDTSGDMLRRVTEFFAHG